MMTQFNAYVISVGVGIVGAGALFYAFYRKRMATL
jgi:hypothetical protein